MILHHLFSGGAPGPRDPAGLGRSVTKSCAQDGATTPRDSATVSGAVISDEWARGRVSGVAYSLISNSTISALLCPPVPRARSISEMAGFGDRRISADSPGPNMLMSLL